MSNDIFGNMFDLNGDGDMSMLENAAAFALLNEVLNDEDNDEDWRDEYLFDDDNLGIDPDEFDSEDEFLEAVEEKRNWIDNISVNLSNLADELCISPEDYDSYDEFVEAVKDAM